MSKVSTDEVIDQATARVFARAYVDNDYNEFVAALTIWKGDSQKAIKMSAVMLANPLVLEAIKHFESDEGIVLPTKNQFSRELWNKLKAADPGDYHKLAELYAKVNGWLDKTSDGPQAGVVPRVMQVPIYGSDEDWEKDAARKQAELKKTVKRR